MKKLLFCLTAAMTALVANTPSVEDTDTDAAVDLSSSVYAPPSAPIREQVETPKTSMAKKAAAVVIGTLAAITIGLVVSGADTGTHAHSDNP